MTTKQEIIETTLWIIAIFLVVQLLAFGVMCIIP